MPKRGDDFLIGDKVSWKRRSRFFFYGPEDVSSDMIFDVSIETYVFARKCMKCLLVQ